MKTLSEKELGCLYCLNGCDENHNCKSNKVLYMDDVKEFIKELKDFAPYDIRDINRLYNYIDELAGEKLI